MIAKVAIIAPGTMGSAVGRRLSEHGARVLTSLTKRSIATVRRAEMTGMIGADDDAIAQADVILSILRPTRRSRLRSVSQRRCPVPRTRQFMSIATPSTWRPCAGSTLSSRRPAQPSSMAESSVRRQGKAATPPSIFLGKPPRLWQGSVILASKSES